MRLIDADKIIYMWKQDINGNFHDGVTLESIVGNTPTVNVNDLIAKELEKVKQEIKELAFLLDDLSHDKELVVDLDNIEEVIDKHITKLEGEQK